MKRISILVLIALISLSAYADQDYKCYSLKRSSLNQETPMKITTSLFSKRITAVELVSEVRSRNLEDIVNPFTTLGLSYDEFDPDVVAEAEKLVFKMISKKDGPSSVSIALSDSLLNLQDRGYAHYQAKSCFWILECLETYEYFKCEKI